MNCIHCLKENPPEAQFCMHCGEELKAVCPKCQSQNPPEARFCMQCGSTLAAALISASKEGQRSPVRPVPQAERRQITIMFCDLVGSTELSEKLDPEDFSELIQVYQSVSGKIIRRFGGHIAQYLGDGLLVYFGYPRAYEDVALRAVRAGLGILETLQVHNTKLADQGKFLLNVRIGIHSGLAVFRQMGDEEKKEMMALGKAINVASRLEGLAATNSLLISEATYKLCKGFFLCESLGGQTLKGISESMNIYKVLNESGARSRLEILSGKDLSPFVGREKEIETLMEAWRQIKTGRGRVVLVSGEAGIGKSRLKDTITEKIARDPQAWLTACRSSPYHQNSFFYPIIDLLERVVLQFETSDSPINRLEKIEGFIVQYDFPPHEYVPLFAELLSIPIGDRYAKLSLPAASKKKKIMDALLHALFARAAQQPVLLVVEDLHWSDPSTLEWLDLFMQDIKDHSILAIFTTRPEFQPNWSDRPYVEQINLRRLSPQYITGICHHYSQGKALPPDLVKHIVEKTDGVPLFVEELTKTVLESDLLTEKENHYAMDGALPTRTIPATLHDSLMARLDRLTPVKEIAQIGSVLGRQFSFGLLHAVSSFPEGVLHNNLLHLVAAEILHQQGELPNATFIFKHALIQDAAYESLLKRKRLQLHQQVAHVIERDFPHLVDTQPELLAQHYSRAGMTEKAMVQWSKAGQIAVQRHANLEAIQHLETSLVLLYQLPPSKQRDAWEFDYLIAKGSALISSRGYTSPEVEKNYLRVLELSKNIDQSPKLVYAYMALWAYYWVRGDYETGLQMVDQSFEVAEAIGDEALLLISNYMAALIRFTLAEYGVVQKHLQEVFRIYDPVKHKNTSFLGFGDLKVGALTYDSLTYLQLGYFDQAFEKAIEAKALAHELNNTVSIYQASCFGSAVMARLNNWQLSQEYARFANELATENGDPFWIGMSSFYLNSGLALQGKKEAVNQMYGTVKKLLERGRMIVNPSYLAVTAQMFIRNGELDKAMQALDDAFAIVEQTGEPLYQSELYRVKGELLRIKGAPVSETEPLLIKALEIARGQQSNFLILQAAKSQVGLWQSQGRYQEAYELLHPVYSWFTEGLQTNDLIKAKELLQVLEKHIAVGE